MHETLSAVESMDLEPRPAWRIVLSDTPTSPERKAGEELSCYLRKTVRSLTVDGSEDVVFLIGDTPRTRELGIRPDDWESEQWAVKSFGPEVAVVGGGPRGTLYAVYHLLEDLLGVHWWNPNEEYVPETADVHWIRLDLAGRPYFKMREICRGEAFPDDGGQFAARNRLNRSGYEEFSAEFGGGYDFGPPFFVHTYDHYLPAAKYLDSHPDYFSLWEGKRIGGQSIGQVCLTHPDVLKIFWTRLVEYIARGEARASDRRVSAPLIFEISHNDNERYCQCAACLKIIENDGHSGLMLRFVNVLAERLQKFRPEVFLSVLAYYRTAAPPRNVRPLGNVIVRLCDTFSNCVAPISSNDNSVFRARVEEWSKISKNLSIWDYSINYREDSVVLPYPSEFLYPETHRFYADHHVRWMFWEHEWPDCADMYDYKVFLEAKYLEDPFREDFEVLRRTFMEGYYGPAADLMIAYRDRLHQAARENHAVLAGFGCCRSDFTFIDLEALLDCHELFDRMAQLSLTDLQASRVMRARLGVDCLVGFALTEFYKDAWNRTRREPFPLDLDAARRRTMESWKNSREGLRPHPVVDAFQKHTSEMRQDRGNLEQRDSAADPGEWEYSLSREMVCCEGAGVRLLPESSPHLVCMEVGEDVDLEFSMGVGCILDDAPCLKSVIFPVPTDELWQSHELTFEFPRAGGIWFLRKRRLDIVHPVTVRLDFLRRLGFVTPGLCTVKIWIKCQGRRFGGPSRSGDPNTVIVGGISFCQTIPNDPYFYSS